MFSSAAVVALLSSAGVMAFVPSSQHHAVKSSALSMSGKPAKFEDEELKRERDEIIRKEQMANMILRKENETFWQTPGDTVIATADKYFVSPAVLQVIDDLDNQLIGLKPVSYHYIA
jgi:hypothetical protein